MADSEDEQVVFLDDRCAAFLERDLATLGWACEKLPVQLDSARPVEEWCDHLGQRSGIVVAVAVPPGLEKRLPRRSLCLLRDDTEASSLDAAIIVDNLLRDGLLRMVRLSRSSD